MVIWDRFWNRLGQVRRGESIMSVSARRLLHFLKSGAIGVPHTYLGGYPCVRRGNPVNAQDV